MSQETRNLVAHHPNVFYSNMVEQQPQLLDKTKTNTKLIAAIEYLCVTRGHIWQFTAIHDDHHPDGYLNAEDPQHTGTHQGGVDLEGDPTGGFAADGWFLQSRTKDDWLDENDERFQHALEDMAQVPYLHQIGLAGAAITDDNKHASGPKVFVDEGDDHIHLGVA